MRRHSLKSDAHPSCDLSKRSSKRKVARISLSILEAQKVQQEVALAAQQETQEAITAHEVQQEVAIAAWQETQEAITAHDVQQQVGIYSQQAITTHEVQQEAAIAAKQETQEVITAHNVRTLLSVAVSIGDQNFILSQKLAQTQLKSNLQKIDHHLPIAAATVI